MAKIWKVLTPALIVLLMISSALLGYFLQETTSVLADTRNVLGVTQAELYSKNKELNNTLEIYFAKEAELKNTAKALLDTQNNLESAMLNLQKNNDLLLRIKEYLSDAKINLSGTLGQLSDSQTQTQELTRRLDSLQRQYDDLCNGYSYVTNNVSTNEVLRFLSQDQTDKNTYDDTYNCFNYTADVIANAYEQHIRCGFVYIAFEGTAHAIVAFDTIDNGIMFFEPQSDTEVDLQINKKYGTECLPPGYYYSPPGYDDTVLSYVIIW